MDKQKIKVISGKVAEYLNSKGYTVNQVSSFSKNEMEDICQNIFKNSNEIQIILNDEKSYDYFKTSLIFDLSCFLSTIFR